MRLAASSTAASAPVQEARLGANPLADGRWQFLLWAPQSGSVSIRLSRSNRVIAMESLEHGYHRAIVDELAAGEHYLYRLEDGRELPDPASRFQPEGVHGPSGLVDTRAFQWSDAGWRGRALEGSVFYELHVGTYTREGTFEAVIAHLPRLVELGITTIEIMPVAQFPGARNWGYDGVYEYAPQNSYGGPDGLQRLVDAIHAHGLAAVLDVVYNHLGPEGNYLSAFAPYFTDRYQTPWGQAINFDGPGSNNVRRFFCENALYWLEDYHFDGLRLDAVHGIFDFSANHFLAELKSDVVQLSQRLGREMQLIAESDLNDSRLLRDRAQGGYGLDAQWTDDFHHSVHTLLTKENRGYYEDFGGIQALVATLQDGWYYRGQYSAHRQRCHGNEPAEVAPSRFVVYNQNHDQVGNRAAGDRLSTVVPFEALKLAAGVTLLSPFTPLIFMGEEYGEPAPFQYFTSHGDAALVEAVRRGRREEFAAFGWQEAVPDPQDEQTFLRSRLDHSLENVEPHKTLFRFYQRLIQLRVELGIAAAASHSVRELGDCQVLLSYRTAWRDLAMIFNFAEYPVTVNVPELEGNWASLLYSAAGAWSGAQLDPQAGSASVRELLLDPYSFVIFAKRASEEVQ
jgi:maltooligosyltrehalose trehalohydrolase